MESNCAEKGAIQLDSEAQCHTDPLMLCHLSPKQVDSEEEDEDCSNSPFKFSELVIKDVKVLLTDIGRYVNHDGRIGISDINDILPRDSRYDSNRESRRRQLLRSSVCPLCQAVLTSYKEKVNHDCPFLKKENGRYMCPHCPKTYKCKQDVIIHQVLHDEPKFECEYCQRKFFRFKEVEAHWKSCLKIPDERRPSRIICDVCGKTFSNKCNLNKHRLSHERQNCPCPICGKLFSRKDLMDQHRRFVHESMGVACPVCQKPIKTEVSLKKHIREQHDPNYQQHSCPDCGKTFRQKANMEKHMLTHDKGKRHQCTLCRARFSSADSLQDHEMSHAQEAKVICKYCNAAFLDLMRYRQHVKQKHNDTIYVCEFCPQKYHSRQSLRRHLTRAHQDKGDLHKDQKYLASRERRVSASDTLMQDKEALLEHPDLYDASIIVDQSTSALGYNSVKFLVDASGNGAAGMSSPRLIVAPGYQLVSVDGNGILLSETGQCYLPVVSRGIDSIVLNPSTQASIDGALEAVGLDSSKFVAGHMVVTASDSHGGIEMVTSEQMLVTQSDLVICEK